MTDQFNKLAERLEELDEAIGATPAREAARILRAAAGVDVAGLMAMVKKATTAHYLLGLASGEWRCTPEHHADKDAADAALESALRLVLAQRVPPGCGAFDEAQERAAFESHLKAELKAHWLYNNPNGHELVDLMVSVTPDEVNGHKQTYAGRYVDKGVETQWHGWRARAAAAPQAKEQTA